MRMIVTPVTWIAGEDRALDRRRPAPARQQQAWTLRQPCGGPVEDRLRQDQAIGGDHRDIGLEREEVGLRFHVAQRLGMAHRDAERLGRALHRRGLQLLAAPGGAGRLGIGGERSSCPASCSATSVGTAKAGVPMKTMRMQLTFLASSAAWPYLPAHGIARDRGAGGRAGAASRARPALGAARGAVAGQAARDRAGPAARGAGGGARARWSNAATCGNVDTQDPCGVCADPRRDARQLCVVEDVADLWALDRARLFAGRYHVLGGRLSALEGVRPEDLVDRQADRARRGGRDRRGRAGDERHARRPDHRALHRRAARGLSRCASPSSPTACRSAASSITSTRARWPRRCGRGGRWDSCWPIVTSGPFLDAGCRCERCRFSAGEIVLRGN